MGEKNGPKLIVALKTAVNTNVKGMLRDLGDTAMKSLAE